jgi:hypothetical protein
VAEEASLMSQNLHLLGLECAFLTAFSIHAGVIVDVKTLTTDGSALRPVLPSTVRLITEIGARYDRVASSLGK